MEEADLLLDRPPGGWGELVTKERLHLELAVIETRLRGIETAMVSIESGLTTIEAEFRAQTWKLIAAMTGLLGALVVAIKL